MVLLQEDEITARLGEIRWQREGRELVKVVREKDFAAALAFVNRVGSLAEEVGHHPDIDIRWNTVTLRLSTHSEGGLTDRDFALAADIDSLDEPR